MIEAGDFAKFEGAANGLSTGARRFQVRRIRRRLNWESFDYTWMPFSISPSVAGLQDDDPPVY